MRFMGFHKYDNNTAKHQNQVNELTHKLLFDCLTFFYLEFILNNNKKGKVNLLIK